LRPSNLVSPIDNANDLHVLGALAPLVRTALAGAYTRPLFRLP